MILDLPAVQLAAEEPHRILSPSCASRFAFLKSVSLKYGHNQDRVYNIISVNHLIDDSVAHLFSLASKSNSLIVIPKPSSVNSEVFNQLDDGKIHIQPLKRNDVSGWVRCASGLQF